MCRVDPQLHDAAHLLQKTTKRATVGVGEDTCYSLFREIYAMPVYLSVHLN